MTQQQSTRERFTCGCGGPITLISPTEVQHACAHKYAPATSFYDDVPKFVTYKRVPIKNTARYNWFVEWESSS